MVVIWRTRRDYQVGQLNEHDAGSDPVLCLPDGPACKKYDAADLIR